MEFTRHALDAATRRLRVTPAERAAVREYQALEGGSERLNAALGANRAPGAEDLWQVTHLDALMKRAVVPVDLVTYRGVGDAAEALPILDEYERRPGYTSTTLDAALARHDFTSGPCPAVLRITVHRGTQALWVPPLGWRELANEQELLLPRGTLVRYGARRTEDALLVVHCEVIPW